MPRSEWQTIEMTDGEMRAYVAATGTAPRGAVIVLQEAFGVNAHIQSVANRFAAAGFLAVAPDLFHRAGAGVLEYAERERAMGLIGELGPDAITADVGAVVRAVREDAPGLSCAVVGFCFGGRAAFTAACTVDDLDAVVMFYGPGVAAGEHAVLDRVDGIGARMLLLYGAEDPTIPAEQREAIDTALQGAGVDYAARVYEDAGHAFFCDARPPLFRPHAALDAWERVTAFLSR